MALCSCAQCCGCLPVQRAPSLMVAGGGVPNWHAVAAIASCCSLVPAFCHAIGIADCATRAMVVAWCDALAVVAVSNMVAGGFLTPWVVVGGVLVQPFKVAVHKMRVF
jgi:hypothetical protein